MAIATRLLQRAGWTRSLFNPSTDYTPVTQDFHGVNVFQGIDAVAKTQRGFFTLVGTNSVKIGRHTDAMRDSVVPIAVLRNAADARGMSGLQISRFSITASSGYIVNRIIPVGQGTGETQITLELSDVETTPYSVLSRPNWDGTNLDGTNPSGALTQTYYLEDTASISRWGVVERVAPFNDIRPVTGSYADRVAAARALHFIASAYMQQHLDPVRNYEIEVTGITTLIKPADVVMVDYRGVASITRNGVEERRTRVFIDKKRFWVLEVSYNFDDYGNPTAKLLLAENGEKILDEHDVSVNLLNDISKFKLRPALSLSYRAMSGKTEPIKPDLSYSMKVKYDTGVVVVNSCKIEFHVEALKSYSSNNSGASSASTTSSGGQYVNTSSSTTSAGGATVTTSGYGGGGTPGVGLWSSGVTPTVTGFAYPKTGGIEGVTGQYGSYTNFQNHWHYGDSAGHQHSLPDMNHSHSIPVHNHSIQLNDHSHSVSISINIPAHSHGMEHTHPQIFDTYKDTVIPEDLTIWFNGQQITPIRNLDNGQIAGNDISTTGWFVVDVTNKLTGNFHGTHEIEIKCGSGRGLVFARTNERITVQPVAYTG